ncbi:MAG TPA: hypothetical protein VF483_01425 [Gemmatimonadaceae bacterium]
MDPISDNTVGVIAIVSIFVLFPIAFAFARYIWKRSVDGPSAKAMPGDDLARRMAELQQSMDSMALEIERIAEGQRFVTKLMSERPKQEIAGGR